MLVQIEKKERESERVREMEFPEDVWREIVSFVLPLSVGCLRAKCVESGIELDVKHKRGDAGYIYCVIYVTSASDFVSRLVAGKMVQVDKIHTCARHGNGTFKVHFTAWFGGKSRKETQFGREEAYYLVGSYDEPASWVNWGRI